MVMGGPVLQSQPSAINPLAQEERSAERPFQRLREQEENIKKTENNI